MFALVGRFESLSASTSSLVFGLSFLAIAGAASYSLLKLKADK